MASATLAALPFLPAIIPFNRTRSGMTNECVDGDFANPAAVRDVIMNGGITSGVVYPLALTELAKQFRLSQVGGTSAGAIAAAAAEYGRHVPGRGFVLLAKLPAEVSNILLSLFQLKPSLRPVFAELPHPKTDLPITPRP
jgi:Patatin-like phospholipase